MAGCQIPWRRPFRRLAKVGVDGSNPFARSRTFYSVIVSG